MENVFARTKKHTIDGYIVEEGFEDGGKYNATLLLRQYNEKFGVNRTMSAYVRNLSAKDRDGDMSVVKLKSAHGRSLNEVWFKPFAFTKFVSWLMGDYGDGIVSEVIVKERLRRELMKAHSLLMDLVMRKNLSEWESDKINYDSFEDKLMSAVFGNVGMVLNMDGLATTDELLKMYALNVQCGFIVRNGFVKGGSELSAIVEKLNKGK